MVSKFRFGNNLGTFVAVRRSPCIIYAGVSGTQFCLTRYDNISDTGGVEISTFGLKKESRMSSRISKLTLAIAVLISGCTVNVGTSEKQDTVVSTLDASNEEALSTTTSITVVDSQSALDLLASEL